LRYITKDLFYIVFAVLHQYFGYFSFINFLAEIAFFVLENIPIQAEPDPVILEK